MDSAPTAVLDGGPAGGADADVAPAATSAGRQRRAPAPAGHNRLTGRATALFVVLALLAVAYTWPVKEYLRQHSELGRLRAETAATQARVDTLQALRMRWADPAYVQAQARERLHFVLPGETAYVVLQPDHPAAPPTLPKPTAQVLPAWYGQLWDTMQGADAGATH
jgi:cell division protein FtsB